jgi:hypothetical protein
LGQYLRQELLNLQAQYPRSRVFAATSTNFVLTAIQSIVVAIDPDSHWVLHHQSQSRDSPAVVLDLIEPHWFVKRQYCLVEVSGSDSMVPLSLDGDSNSKLEVEVIWNGCSD